MDCDSRMRDELERVLAYPQIAKRLAFYALLPEAVLAARDALVHTVAVADKAPVTCKDPDDQVFIDLALHVGATWLFSKDAALLKLARRARTRGVNVMSLQTYVANQLKAAELASAADSANAASA